MVTSLMKTATSNGRTPEALRLAAQTNSGKALLAVRGVAGLDPGDKVSTRESFTLTIQAAFGCSYTLWGKTLAATFGVIL